MRMTRDQSLQHTTERALINHCIHALKLIEFRGPYSHMFGMEHLCFTELLPYWVLLWTTTPQIGTSLT